MKFLNLFAGIGGNRLPWGFNHEITAIEIEDNIAGIYQARFPGDIVIVEDAYKYLVEHFHEFDKVWASPPCPSHSKMSRTHVGRRYNGWKMKVQLPDFRLYEIIVFLSEHFRGDWIVENVKPFYKKFLDDNLEDDFKYIFKPTAVVGRHYIWSNKPIKDKKFNIKGIMYKYDSPDGYKQYIKQLCDVYMIDFNLLGKIKDFKYTDDISQVLRNMIHPKIAEYIWKQINKKTTESLF
jgi:DNA (cytosine-5)-methyltransferase 1